MEAKVEAKVEPVKTALVEKKDSTNKKAEAKKETKVEAKVVEKPA